MITFEAKRAQSVPAVFHECLPEPVSAPLPFFDLFFEVT